MRKIKKKKGLTLIELLAVIAIIAILFVLLIPQINSAIYKSRISGIQVDLHDYEIGVRSYLMENCENGNAFNLETMNTYLNKNLRFKNTEGELSSEEKNGFKTPYYFENKDGVLTVETTDDRKKEHAIKVKCENQEIAVAHISPDKSKDNEEDIVYSGEGGERSPIDGTQNNVEIPDLSIEEEEEDTPKKILKRLEDESDCNTRTIEETPASYFKTASVTGGLGITGYTGTGLERIVVPCEINGKKVVSISKTGTTGAFQNKSLKEIVIHNYIKEIKSDAFIHNDIKYLVIPESVTTIGVRFASENPNIDIILNKSSVSNDTVKNGTKTDAHMATIINSLSELVD